MAHAISCHPLPRYQLRSVWRLLADAHAADVLDAVRIDKVAALEVADRAHLFINVDRGRRAVDWAAGIVPVVRRGDRAAGDDATEQAECSGTTDADAVTGLRSWLGAAQGNGGQGGCADSLQISTHHPTFTICRRLRALLLRGAASTGAARCGRRIDGQGQGGRWSLTKP